MLSTRAVLSTISVGLMVLGAGMVSGQAYPSKTIRIFTFGAGGNADIYSRVLGQGISGPLGQQIVIENRGQFIPVETVARAQPDGYSLLVTSNNLWIGPLLQKMSWDPVKDFAPITTIMRTPSILVVHPSVPAKSVKELIALAKARPGELNNTYGSLGATAHMSAELLKAMTNVKIVSIAYKNDSQEIADLLSGYVQLTFQTPARLGPFIKSGKLRALAVTSAEPSALAPGLPTMAASGLPGFESILVMGAWAPANTPPAIINRLNQEAVRFLKTAETKERLLNGGVEAAGSTPEELAAFIKSDMTKMGKVIKDAGIRTE